MKSQKIAVAGHSYIARATFSTEGIEVPIKKFCYGGANAKNFLQSSACRHLESYSPDVVYLHIGGNDINDSTTSAEVYDRIVNIVNRWTHLGMKVFVGEIEHRTKPWYISKAEYDRKRYKVNRALRRTYGRRFRNYRRLNESHVGRDGVHLSHEGNRIFQKEISSILRRMLH